MLNNSGPYGPNEAPPNIIASIDRPQPDATNISQNFNDFARFPQQAASSATGFYEAYNFHNFGRSPVTMPPITHPFQGYHSFGHESSNLPQNTHISYENPVQNYLPNVNTTLQAEHHSKMLNFDPNFHTKLVAQQHSTVERGSINKGYPLNIPQVPSRLFQNSPKIDKNSLNPQNLLEKILTSPQIAPQVSSISNISNIKNTELKSDMKSPSSDAISSQNTPEEPLINKDHQTDTETPKNISHKPPENKSETPPIIQKTTYNIIKNNSTAQKSIFEKCFNENKRKSLEKTVRLIESILINSNNSTKSEIENTVDPLALSPMPDITGNTDIAKETLKDNDEELLVTKKSKRKSKMTKKSAIQSIEPSKEVISPINVKIEDVKLEALSWPDIEYGNPFHRDCNGMLQTDADYGSHHIIDLGSSEQDAIEMIRSGSTTNAYFECPHCSLLLQHPKRFLIHTKWHSFGLLNEKRAEILKQREDRTRAKRQARSMQRLNETLTSGIEGVTRFSCKDCDGVFPTKTSLKNHRRQAHSSEVTECRICFVPVRDANELRTHLATHEASGSHQCPQCPKKFKYRHSLAKHADTHREKIHSCTECGKLFGSNALVRLHMKVHERAARGTTHRCAYCGKGFYEAYNLHVHERTHRNERPFKCDICESRFVTNSSLKRHMKVSHSGAKPFPCQVCQKCFMSATIRDRHELRAHSDLNQFTHPCKLCPRRYMKQKDLRSHTNKMHPKEKTKNEPSDVEQISS